MYSLILFITITVIETIFVLWKWSDIRDYQNIATDVASVTNLDKQTKYKKITKIFGNLLNNFRKFLIIPIILILLVNFIASTIVGSLIHLVVYLISLI